VEEKPREPTDSGRTILRTRDMLGVRRKVVALMGKVRTVLGVVAAGGVLSLVGSTGVVEATTDKVVSVFVSNDDANPVPTRAVGATAVTGAVTVANGADAPIPVTSSPRKNVVLQDPRSGDEIRPATPMLYSFDTSALSTARLGFQALSGSESCHIEVYLGGFKARTWDLTGQFGTVGEAFEAPGERIVVRVETNNVCYSMLGAWGLPIG
jgi:hypothetical protein